MFQALGLVAAGFLLHWLLNRPMDAAPPTTDADPATIPEGNDTPPTLEAYSDPPFSVIEYAPETSTMAQYVVAKDGAILTGPDGYSPAYSYPTLAEAVNRVNALKEADSDPMGPVGPEDAPEPEPAPGDLPGMPGSGGGFGGGYGGLGGDSSALPVFGGNIGGVGANDAQYGLQW